MSVCFWASTISPKSALMLSPPCCPVLSHPPLPWPLLRFCKMDNAGPVSTLLSCSPNPLVSFFLPWEGVAWFPCIHAVEQQRFNEHPQRVGHCVGCWDHEEARDPPSSSTEAPGRAR